MNSVLWVVQGGLSCIFLFQGWLKVFRPATLKAKGLEDVALLLFIGFCEMLGAAGLLLPALTGVMTWLTSLSALGITAIMFLAFRYHLKRHEGKDALQTFLLLTLAVSVAVGRLVVPIT